MKQADKSVQTIEIPVYFRYSKTSSPNQMLHDVLEAQANRIVKDIITNGHFGSTASAED